MALLTKLKKYVQLKDDGIIEIHRSIEDRLKQKLATPSSVILKAYDEKINTEVEKMYQYVKEKGLDIDNLTEEEYEVLATTDPFIIEHSKIANDWGYEKFLYQTDLEAEKGTTRAFPLMAEIYKDVANSIPYIIEKSKTYWDADNIIDIYMEAKEKLRFGETEDC